MVSVNADEASTMSQQAKSFNWILSTFVERTVGANEAVVVSSDGFLLAASSGRDGHGMEQLAAIISGMTSLSHGAAAMYEYGDVRQIIIEMETGFIFVMSVGDGSALGVLADGTCDVGAVGYEMALMVDRVGSVLTPSLISELKNVVSV